MARADAIEGKARMWREDGRWVVELEFPGWVLGDFADESQRDTATRLMIDDDAIAVTAPVAHLKIKQD